MSTDEAIPAPEMMPALASETAPEDETPPTLREPTFDEATFTVAQPLPPALPDLPPPAHPGTVTAVTAVTPVVTTTAATTTPAATGPQAILVSELLETGGASVVRRVFSLIGLVLMAVFLGATIAAAVAGVGVLITLAAQHAGG